MGDCPVAPSRFACSPFRFFALVAWPFAAQMSPIMYRLPAPPGAHVRAPTPFPITLCVPLKVESRRTPEQYVQPSTPHGTGPGTTVIKSWWEAWGEHWRFSPNASHITARTPHTQPSTPLIRPLSPDLLTKPLPHSHTHARTHACMHSLTPPLISSPVRSVTPSLNAALNVICYSPTRPPQLAALWRPAAPRGALTPE